MRAPEGTNESPYSEADSAYSPPPLQTHYLYRPCALTESPHTLLPRALMRSYRERKRALGKSVDLLSIPPIQRELARRGKKEVIIPLQPSGLDIGA